MASRTRSNVELIKDHLDYDGENYVLPKYFPLRSIVATHGMQAKSVFNLIAEGKFSGGSHALRGEFYTTPNPKSGVDIDSLRGVENLDMHDWAGIDAVGAAVQYAGSIAGREIQGATHHDIDNGIRLGAVVAFGGKLSLQDAEINIDPTTAIEEANGIELVLPQAPSIETVQGIYPLDAQSAYFFRSTVCTILGR